MKRALLILFIALLGITLVACSDNDNAENEELHILTADLVVPEQADVNEEIEFKSTVTYGEENVTDADEVVYEVWEEGQKDQSTMIESTNNEDGTYTATTSFDKDGIFHVQVHVTAKDQHTMPKLSVTVGEGGEYDSVEEESDDEHDHMNHSEDEDADNHGDH